MNYLNKDYLKWKWFKLYFSSPKLVGAIAYFIILSVLILVLLLLISF